MSERYRVEGWCPLCGQRITARDDESTRVCPACGALLDVMPTPSGTTVRHTGEAMDTVRYSLELGAVERALARLRETREARREALRDAIQRHGVQRFWFGVAAGAVALGIVAFLLGHGSLGAGLVLVGMLGLTGRFAPLWLNRSSPVQPEHDAAQRGDDRDAARLARALDREIARREAVLAAMREGRPW